MKYVVVLGDGMADLPLPELEQKTPLAYATTPMMDELAKKSEIGMVHTVPDGMSPGSDTANLSVLGYDQTILFRTFTLGSLEHWRADEGYGCGTSLQSGDVVRRGCSV